MRNLFGNIMLMDMSGVGLLEQPVWLSGAAKEMLRSGTVYRKAVRDGAISGSYSAEELRAMDGLATVPLDHSFLGRLLVDVADKLSALPPARVYGLVEDWFKLAKYMHGIANGLSSEHAAMEAQRWLFNYSKVPKFIRIWRSLGTDPRVSASPQFRAIALFLGDPFITFPYKAVPAVIDSFLENPMRIVKWIMLAGLMSNFSARLHDLSYDDLQLLRKNKRLGPLDVITPLKDEDGTPLALRLEYLMPYASLGDYFQFANEVWKGIPSRVWNPFLALGILWSVGVDPEVARQVEDVDLAKIGLPGDEPGVIVGRKFFETVSKLLTPPLIDFQIERWFKAVNGIPDSPTAKPPSPFVETARILGLPLTQLDVQRAARTQAIRLREELRDLASAVRSGRVKPEEVQERIQRIRERTLP
jgi:hypothetical protein